VREFWSVIEPGKAFVDGEHIRAICLHLEAVSTGKILRLLVNMPPRHAKSTIISVFWPVWTWIHNPALRWLCASYALNLATRDNVKCRRLIQSPLFQERFGYVFHLTKDQNAKMKFETTQLGYRMAVSVGSSATGEGGDILLLDDPHSIDEKESDVKREAALDWFDNTWSTRLNDQQTGAMVVVGQRIHAEDISGHILKTNDGEWTHLNLSAMFEPAHACETRLPDGSLFWRDWRNHEGELLWPSRFPLAVLERAKRRHGAFGFSALYQQSPVPATGGTFKREWFRYFRDDGEYFTLHGRDGDTSVARRDCQIFAVNDPAISTKQEADYSVVQVWALTPRRELLLLAQVRAHLDNPQQVQTITAQYQRWHWEYIAVETVYYALALYQQLRVTGMPVQEYRPARDKLARASVAAVRMEAGDIYFLEGAEYLPDLESEVLKFPRDAHDDIVDCVSMAADLASVERGGRIRFFD